jgi:hypothetical protein
MQRAEVPPASFLLPPRRGESELLTGGGKTVLIVVSVSLVRRAQVPLWQSSGVQWIIPYAEWGERADCRATDELQGQPVVPQGTKGGSNNCQFHISVEGLSATGQWVSPAKTLPINLHQVAYLDGTDDNHFRFGGPLEIPMWYHTKKDLLVGIYTTDASDEDCLLSMAALRLVNVKTGAIDRVIEFDCGAGNIATVIYSNVFKSETPGSVVVELMGGDHGMGQDSDVKLSH